MLMTCSITYATSSGGPVKAVVVKINSVIDYVAIDLVQRATAEVEKRDNGIMIIIELSADRGYLAPTLEIIQRLTSQTTKVVVYVGPHGASALSFAPYIAMAGSLLVMNDGTSIGAAGLNEPNSMNLMMSTMRSLAKANGRNAVAAESMVLDNRIYSADEALAKGVCDREINNYDNLFAMLNIDPSNVIVIQNSQIDVNLHEGNTLLHIIATHSFVELMFVALTLLVVFNIASAFRRRRKVTDEPYQHLLNLLRMEIQSLEQHGVAKTRALPATPLHTSPDIPPPPNINRIPTTSSHKAAKNDRGE
jgi:membrane-bound ClpP family serine protease